ncbi:hypothetical protein GCK72_020659 [Caenorhabditis remanei]|uniref:Uncharacterized protein n=1 Tax=Caenorhabditis remanei TaxID=31234 RepID=A0A6A5GHM6_CAERE|nr:hypothetical protein GCK72_020653 [Caenorhabditis remanei]XP_053582635.1 hypothetical protein GCK72_020659 [Caenorhabditis remanei]KAF1754095.1 hypothetical protein GCK72_020653 [Caenorhabditis remanei]KAF1754101.1 hypothetical protein GCK72_020659 [Caenorhabditis remanei]
MASNIEGEVEEAVQHSLSASRTAGPAFRRSPPRESAHGSGLPSSVPIPIVPSSTEDLDWYNRNWEDSPPTPLSTSPSSVKEETVVSFEEITLEMLALQNHEPIQMYSDVVSGADFSRLVREFKERVKNLSRTITEEEKRKLHMTFLGGEAREIAKEVLEDDENSTVAKIEYEIRDRWFMKYKAILDLCRRQQEPLGDIFTRVDCVVRRFTLWSEEIYIQQEVIEKLARTLCDDTTHFMLHTNFQHTYQCLQNGWYDQLQWNETRDEILGETDFDGVVGSEASEEGESPLFGRTGKSLNSLTKAQLVATNVNNDFMFSAYKETTNKVIQGLVSSLCQSTMKEVGKDKPLDKVPEWMGVVDDLLLDDDTEEVMETLFSAIRTIAPQILSKYFERGSGTDFNQDKLDDSQEVSDSHANSEQQDPVQEDVVEQQQQLESDVQSSSSGGLPYNLRPRRASQGWKRRSSQAQ